MTVCQNVQARLSEFIDGTIAGDDRAAIAAHLATCEACSALASDLARIRTTARALGPVAPPDHLWRAVAGRLEAASPTSAPAAATARRPDAWRWIGLAAALVVVTLGAYLVVRVRTPHSQTPAADVAGAGNAAATGAVEGIEQELKTAEAHYDTAIGELEAIVKGADGPIDPVTAEALRKNLPVMDQAIAESRAALSTSPADPAAQASLFEALRQKVNVLQDTVALMNEMRTSDQEAAARAAAGMGKS